MGVHGEGPTGWGRQGNGRGGAREEVGQGKEKGYMAGENKTEKEYGHSEGYGVVVVGQG